MKSSCFQFSYGFYDTIAKKEYVLKRFCIENPSKIKKFLEYLRLITEFYDYDKFTTQTNLVIDMHFSKNNEDNLIYVVQNIKSTPIFGKIDTLKEIDVIWILKKIVSLYSHLMKEDKLLPLIIEIGINPINSNTIYLYTKNFKSNRLTKNKIKFDLLSFGILNENSEKPNQKNIHLTEFSDFIRLFDVNKFGVCLRGLLHRIDEKKNVTWDLMFAHPLFLQEIDSNINKTYWKLTEEDKKYLKSESDYKKKKKKDMNNGKKPVVNKSCSTNEENYTQENKKNIMDEIKITLLNGVRDAKKMWYSIKDEKEYDALVGWMLHHIAIFKLAKISEYETTMIKTYQEFVKNSKNDIEEIIVKRGFISKDKINLIKRMINEKNN